MNMFLWWLLLLFLFFALGNFLGDRRDRGRTADGTKDARPSADDLAEMEQSVAPLIDVTGRNSKGRVVVFEGHLLTSPAEAMSRLQSIFEQQGLTPMLHEGGEGNEVRIVLAPLDTESTNPKPKWLIHGVLFALTLVTTTWAGALHAGVNLQRQPAPPVTLTLRASG